MGSKLTSRAERKAHATKMLNNMRLAGIEPAIEDKMLLQFYIAGTITLNDLLTHAHQFAASAQKSDEMPQKTRQNGQ